MTHTLGPWTITDGTDITGIENDPKNGCVGPVDVAHVYLRTVLGRTEANARLIAAAPELLEALESMVEMVEMNGFGKAYAMDIARAAIEKARGQG
jgi:hypothetical protein